MGVYVSVCRHMMYRCEKCGNQIDPKKRTVSHTHP